MRRRPSDDFVDHAQRVSTALVTLLGGGRIPTCSIRGYCFAGRYPLSKIVQGHSSKSKSAAYRSRASHANGSATALLRFDSRCPRARFYRPPVIHQTTHLLINTGDCSTVNSASFIAASRSLMAKRLSSTATRSSVHSAASRKLRREQSKTASEICIIPPDLELNGNSPRS
jgi:hypothetical protein